MVVLERIPFKKYTFRLIHGHMGNLVALDMSNNCLEVFELSMVLQSLKILNLQNSRNLFEIRNINMTPNLETLILWNCHSLVYVCETIRGLKSLSLLNMTGCKNLFIRAALSERLKTSNSDRGSTYKSSFPMPSSLERLFLKGCKLEQSDHSPLNFSDQSSIEYLNLGNNPFEFLPNVRHLRNLRVLDLSLCSRLKNLLSLPSTLVELHINHCELLEKVTFESCRFTLQKLVYEGCKALSEIEGFFKLILVAKHDESDLGHMKWLKEHQDHEVCLVGVHELTKSRSLCVQVLYEFGIMSTSLPDMKIPQMMMPVYTSEKTSALSFRVPKIPKNRRLTGLNMTFKYRIAVAGDDLVWFAKISTSIGVDLIYNPTVFGRPAIGEVGIWFSYWPIGNMYIKDEINVSIVVISGLEVCECGASLVYTNGDTVKDNMEWVETLGGDLSAFQLSNKTYYLCRRDFFDKMEVDEPTPLWFRNIVGGNIDHADVRGWGMTGRPKQSSSSFTQLKIVRDEGTLAEESYNVTEKSETAFEVRDAEAKALNMMSKEPIVNEDIKKMESFTSEFIKLTTKESKTPTSILNHHTPPSISMAFPGANALSHDVFLSFRGEDTRHSFMDHIFAALVRAGIRPFRDSDDRSRGQEIYSEIERAIKASKASIILLSQNYAASSWCLDELSLILLQRRAYDHFVLPVFYHVDPLDVRRQTNTFKIEVKTSTRWTDHNVNRWKKALSEVANLSGLVVSGSETQLVKEIMDTIYNKLANDKDRLPLNRVRMDTLSEIEDYIEMELVAELHESDLGHMKWLKEYQNHKMCLVGDNDLTIGRRSYIQMLYEFDIMSTSLPDTKDPNMTQYISESPSLCFEVHPYPKNRRLKGLDVIFKYTISGDDLVWFAKVNTTNGLDLIYNPTVFGKPESGEVGLWFSYWPIGNKLTIGDKVNVSIIVMSGLKVIECGASLVYTYDVADEKLVYKTGWGETLGGDYLSRFQLSTGAYYLCWRDFYSYMEAGRLSPDWFKILVGETIDYTELRGRKRSGRTKRANPRFTDLN